MMDGNPDCRTDGRGGGLTKKSVFDILLPTVSSCVIDGIQKSVMKCQKVVILPGSSPDSAESAGAYRGSFYIFKCHLYVRGNGSNTMSKKPKASP